ncbi:hypothetical protein OG568_52700 (plasmid) [Streptomyces sp. NBC_01450]|uniref:hypothetical protein n=1 Tax=Streptomyces sp. NBC_01450 TaxID=2903871 RepID=UPI002E36E78E|nr:hypothetical protein [Streptomyces sp. NBC_01450]
MLALAFLARPADPTRAAHNRTPIDLTLSQIRRLIGMLLVPPTRTLTTLLHWSTWRRHHPAAARRNHYQRRLTTETTT